jgi:hypothetical protein
MGSIQVVVKLLPSLPAALWKTRERCEGGRRDPPNHLLYIITRIVSRSNLVGIEGVARNEVALPLPIVHDPLVKFGDWQIEAFFNTHLQKLDRTVVFCFV